MRRPFLGLLKALPLGVLLPVALWVASVGPEEVTSNLSKWSHWIGVGSLPTWFTSASAETWFLVVAVAAPFAYAAFMWRKRIAGTWIAFGSGGFIPLTEAAALAYEEAREKGSWWAHAAEELGGDPTKNVAATPQEITEYIATLIAKKIPVYGVRPPSRIVEKVDTKRLSIYGHLQVRRSDFKSVLEYVRTSHRSDDRI
jgi:hypothetical protein